MSQNKLEIAKEYAIKKDGKCLSVIYVNTTNKLEWKCKHKEHHYWCATYKQVVNYGQWCPQCGEKRNIQENRVKNVLSYLLQTDFIKIKPKWNINPETGRLLELDGYSEKLKVAFEYQGEHHFFTSNFNNQEKLDYIQRKDSYKRKNCDVHGVKLITVNVVKNGNKFEEFIKEIYRAIKEADINHNNNDEIILKKLFNKTNDSDTQKEQFLKAKEYALFRDGQCLSDKYVNIITPMKWKCHDDSHEFWFSSYSSIVNNKTWCSKCGDKSSSEKQKNSKGLERAKQYAISKEGECLSTEYINNKTHLQWKCNNKNHKSWTAPYDRVVLAKRWCPECANNKKLNGLEEAKKYATSKNGSCLSTKYVNTKTKMEWTCCDNTHNSWLSNYEHVIKRNQWCPQCYKESRKLKS